MIGIVKKRIDYTAFCADMDRFVNQYLSVPYSEIDVAKLISGYVFNLSCIFDFFA